MSTPVALPGLLPNFKPICPDTIPVTLPHKYRTQRLIEDITYEEIPAYKDVFEEEYTNGPKIVPENGGIIRFQMKD
ncbi:MAG: hypothetical protein QW491_09980 [Thermoproteota archaeon]